MTESTEAGTRATDRSRRRPRQPTRAPSRTTLTYPEKFLEFMRTGWRDTELAGRACGPRPPNHAKRRAALVRRVPRRDAGHPDRPREGPRQRHRLPVPPGQRLRLADRRARPGQRAGHAAERLGPRRRALRAAALPARHRRVLPQRRVRRAVDRPPAHARARSPPSWASRPRTWPSWPRRSPTCAPGRTRVLRGLDPHGRRGRASVRQADARHARPGAGRAHLRAAAGQGRVGDRPAAGRDRRDRARLRGRGPDPARPTAPVSERLLEGVFGLRARHDGNDVGLQLDRRRRRARHDPALDPQRPARTRPGELLLHGHGRGEPQPLHRRRHPDAAGRGHVHARCSARSTTSCYASQQAGMDVDQARA